MAQVSVAQDGIQKLLGAEQEAQQIVAKARKGQHGRCVCLRSLVQAVERGERADSDPIAFRNHP